ncbi:MAG TPA: hypothetical protein VKA02_04855 [Candidatus Acidoferrum sp.]|nr:hypothetical protein [Candidatus Acidoferrum sp.]
METAARTIETPERGVAAKDLFPLDAKRSVTLQSDGKTYRHFFRRVTAADYEVYFKKLTLESPDEDSSFAPSFQSQVVNRDEGLIALYAQVVERVEGYRVRDGRDPNGLPNWPACIPLEHRLRAAELLLDFSGRVPMETLRVEADGKSVSFVFLVDVGELEPATRFHGVVHTFRAPHVEHSRKFLLAASGNPSTAGILHALYDELIEGVQGYSVAGRPLDSREEIVREMDDFHKQIAVIKLLSALHGDAGEPLRVKTAAIPKRSSGAAPPVALDRGAN